MAERDYAGLSEICATVYPTEVPYTPQELAAHHRVFPEGQFVVEHSQAIGQRIRRGRYGGGGGNYRIVAAGGGESLAAWSVWQDLNL